MTIGIAEPLMRKHILKAVLEDGDFLAAYAPHLRGEDFPSPEEAWLVDTAVAFYTTYSHAPVGDAIWVELERARAEAVLTDEQVQGVIAIHDQLPARDLQREYILTRAGEWLRAQAMIRVATRVLADVQVGKADRVMERFEEVLAIGRDLDTGVPSYLLFEGVERWWDELHAREAAAVGTGIPALDAIVQGGLRKGNLGVWLAASNKGKSHALVHCARVAARLGKRVYYVSLEMDEHGVMARLMSTFTGIDSREVWEVPKARMVSLLREQQVPGEIVFERHTADIFSVADLRRRLQLLVRSGPAIDLVVLDYADLLSWPTRNKENEYTVQGKIFTALRAVGTEFDVPVWTATQTNREALRKKVVDLSVIGDSYAKARVADLILAICREQADEVLGTARIYTAKVRYGLANKIIPVLFDAKTSTFREDPKQPPEDAVAAIDGPPVPGLESYKIGEVSPV